MNPLEIYLYLKFLFISSKLGVGRSCMYIFCFFNSILHNNIVFILKFEDNSIKEEELQNLFLRRIHRPLEKATGLDIMVFLGTHMGSLSHEWIQLLTKIWSPICSFSWINKKIDIERRQFLKSYKFMVYPLVSNSLCIS
jgi:hypothetical protein